VVLIVGVAAILNWRTYTVDYRASYDRHSWNTTEAAAVIREWAPYLGGVDHAYIKSYPHWFDFRNIAFNLGAPEWDNVITEIEKVERGDIDGPEPRLIIVHPEDRAALRGLERMWAGGEQYRFQSRVPGKEFWVFVQPGYHRE
jgi:hypothetical protein